MPRTAPMSLLFLKENASPATGGGDGDPTSGEAAHASGSGAVFHDALTLARIGGQRRLGGAESRRLNLAGIDSDPTEVRLPPGAYRVLASRGPEYSVTEARL